MSIIKVSEQHINNIESYIQFIKEKYDKNLSKTQIIKRAIKNYHYIIESDMIHKNDNNEYKMISIDDNSLNLLKRDKQRLGKPMYLILDACLNQTFDYSGEKNVALCQFKGSSKIYAFYFDNKVMKIHKRDLVKVQTNDQNNNELKECIAKVRALGYVENAKDKHKPVIEVIK